MSKIEEAAYHNPVLLQEAVDGLAIKPSGVYVDITFGGGGHSKEILKRLGDKGRLYAFDQDQDALRNRWADDRLVLIPENFRYVKRFLRFHGVREVDGILGDFGVSSHQFDAAQRGFSTRFDSDLDMRMDQSKGLSAYQVINDYEDAQLQQVLFRYGELRNAPKMARAIGLARSKQPIKTGGQLKAILEPFIPKQRLNKMLAQVYQAIRIEVNQELEALKAFLEQTPDLLRVDGRLSLISYHSLEDRLVKRYIRSGKFEGEAQKDMYGHVSVPFQKVGKLVVPGPDEIGSNNRARSAKLRIAKRIASGGEKSTETRHQL